MAKALEDEREFGPAREQWLLCLPLLPAESKQAEWIRRHAQDLQGSANAVPQSPNRPEWIRKLGPLAPIVLLLLKGKSLLILFKLNFLVSLFAFLGIYWGMYGMGFGIGLTALLLVHEMGHYVDIRRRGLPAEMPVFLPGLGAYVRWRALGVTEQTRAFVSLAGPLAGWVSSAFCALFWWHTHNGLWAALAQTGASLNLLNLIPLWVLDGGQAARAMSKLERIGLLIGTLVFAFAFWNGLFLLVAAGVAIRVFIKDTPATPSPRTTVYFLALLALYGLILRLVPR